MGIPIACCCCCGAVVAVVALLLLLWRCCCCCCGYLGGSPVIIITPHRAATTETTTFSTLSHKDGVVCTPTMRSRYTAPGSGSGGSLSGSRSRIRRMPAAARTALEFSREIVGPSLSGIHIGGVNRAMGWYCHHIEPTDVGRLFQCKPFAPG